MAKQQIHCPHCGEDVTRETETEHGIFCPKGCGDFWASEAIPTEELKNYAHSPTHNMMIRGKLNPTVVRCKEVSSKLTCGCIAQVGEPIVWAGNIAFPGHHCLKHAKDRYGREFRAEEANRP